MDGQSSQPFAVPSGSESGIPQAPMPASSTDNLGPVPRVVRTLNKFPTTQARYPQIDDTASGRPPPPSHLGVSAHHGWYAVSRWPIFCVIGDNGIYEFTYWVWLFTSPYFGSSYTRQGEGGREVVLREMWEDLAN